MSDFFRPGFRFQGTGPMGPKGPRNQLYGWPPPERKDPDTPFWPKKPFTMPGQNPLIGRGYLVGGANPVPALAGVSNATNPAVLLVNHGMEDRIGRWKVTLMTKDPAGNDVQKSGAGLRFITTARMENDQIPRTCFVTIDDAQVIYAPGRSLFVTVENPNNFALTADWNIDEVTAGLASWEDRQEFVPLAVETSLVIPTFCDVFEVYGISGAAGPVLNGYAEGGVLVYSETLSSPRSGALRRLPGIDYTLAPSGPAATKHIVLYVCDG